MSFWEANRGLVIGAAVALLAALAIHYLVAGPSRTAAVTAESKNVDIRAKILRLDPNDFLAFFDEERARLAPEIAWPDKGAPGPTDAFREFVEAALAKYLGGRPEKPIPQEVVQIVLGKLVNDQTYQSAPDARKAIQAEQAKLTAALDKVNGLLLTLPKEYLVPKDADNPRFNIFERKLADSRKKCNDSGLFPRYDQSKPENCPLGFTPEVQKEEVALLLQRLCAADRLSGAVIESASYGPFRAQSITHGRAGLASLPAVTRMHLRLLPLTIRAVTDEKGLMAFLERISREGSFLALQELHVEVTDPKAKTFNFTAEVMALVPRDGPGPRKPAGPGGQKRPLLPPPPIGRY